MSSDSWSTKRLAVTSLHLDAKNPRLGQESDARAPRQLVQYLFEHDKTLEVAESIAHSGFFPNEPLLAFRDDDRFIIVEGNRRLAALKALREPGLLEGPVRKTLERLARSINDPASISQVPVTIAPSRRATDRYLVSRHVGTPVRRWEPENRASFILEKLEEGYDNESLRVQLGFTLADIQSARQTRTIADMARSIELPKDVKAKLDSPRARLFTTLGRVFESPVGRDFFLVEPSAEHGLRGKTAKSEFVRAFAKLVSDVAHGHATSRTLNKPEDIKKYFDSWKKDERPKKRHGSFVPADVVKGRSVASPRERERLTHQKSRRSKRESKTVLPKDLKVRFGNDRVIDIHRELTRLKCADFPNAGAVLLRVFLELTVLHFLERTGDLPGIIARLKERQQLQYGAPTMRQLTQDLIRIAKTRLERDESNMVEKAIKYDAAAPFTLSDLHAFVHKSAEMPTDKDIKQFWLRTQPLFRLMLERDLETEKR